MRLQDSAMVRGIVTNDRFPVHCVDLANGPIGCVAFAKTLLSDARATKPILHVDPAADLDPDPVSFLSMVLTAVRQSPSKPSSDSGASRRPVALEARLSVDRTEWLARARLLETEAKKAADDGNIQLSAQKILAALDCERRAGTVGPQVLQLIKPRA